MAAGTRQQGKSAQANDDVPTPLDRRSLIPWCKMSLREAAAASSKSPGLTRVGGQAQDWPSPRSTANSSPAPSCNLR